MRCYRRYRNPGIREFFRPTVCSLGLHLLLLVLFSFEWRHQQGVIWISSALLVEAEEIAARQPAPAQAEGASDMQQPAPQPREASKVATTPAPAADAAYDNAMAEPAQEIQAVTAILPIPKLMPQLAFSAMSSPGERRLEQQWVLVEEAAKGSGEEPKEVSRGQAALDAKAVAAGKATVDVKKADSGKVVADAKETGGGKLVPDAQVADTGRDLPEARPSVTFDSVKEGNPPVAIPSPPPRVSLAQDTRIGSAVTHGSAEEAVPVSGTSQPRKQSAVEGRLVAQLERSDHPVVQAKDLPKDAIAIAAGGELALEIAGENIVDGGVKIYVLYQSYPRDQHTVAMSREDGELIKRLAPKMVMTKRNTLQAILDSAPDGIYDFRAKAASARNLNANFTVAFNGLGTQKRRKALGAREVGSDVSIVKIMMPEGIVWDDKAAFDGSIEDTESITKYRSDTGLVWREYKRSE